ncbi:MAG: glycine cleavage system protein H [Deltaproteobacteria bacterium]|nr:glycine cleavage system protein H [Deltaproteobacteria bacterium]
MEIQGYKLPDELYYEKNQFWVRPEQDVIVMGMNDFAQQMAGQIVFVQLPEPGKTLTAGKKFAKIESGKWVGKVFAPVSGVLVESNQALETNPGLINQDCYGAGWMYKIKPNDMADINQLIYGQEAVTEWMLASIETYKR